MSVKQPDDVSYELDQIKEVVESCQRLQKKIGNKLPDEFEVLAFAVILHSFYNGVENVLKIIVKESGGNLPESPHWHKELLYSMTRPGSWGKPVFSERLTDELNEYLVFRHIFRNLYSFKLRWGKMETLLHDLPYVYKKLKTELQKYQAR